MIFSKLIRFIASVVQQLEHQICNLETKGQHFPEAHVDYTEDLCEALSHVGDVNLVEALYPGTDLVCIAGCEDCGRFVVTDPSFISLIEAGGDIMGVVLCIYCERPVTDGSIDQEMVSILRKRGVKMLEWNK